MTDRDRLIELLNNSFAEQYEKRGLLTAPHTADDLLANGVIVQKKGEWQDNHNGTYACSICGGRASKMSYCGKCGAKLKELG